ncbi:MAG: GNAT family N-acetyltransferase [Pseudomonadota bacterium]
MPRHSSFRYQPADPADRPAIMRELALAFGFPPERAAEYIDNIGLSHFRVLAGSRGVAAIAALVRTGHFLGGRSVPAANICHIAIAPQWRGHGLARQLLAELEAEAMAQGAAMTTLFASARPVYRKAGYELAGSEIIYEAETAALPTRLKDIGFTALAGDIAGHLRTAAPDRGAIHNGLLDRADSHWRELLRSPRHALAAYAVDGDAGRGYALIDTADENCLSLRDWHARDGAAAEAILAFLSGFRSVYPKLRWHGAPNDDLIFAMPDKGWKLLHQEDFMAKIIDPRQALAARGYACPDAQLDFTLVGEKQTRFGLAISNGKAAVTQPGGGAGVSLREIDLAPLFTSYRPASFLARAGRLTGDAAAIALCDLIFAGPLPWSAEHF